MRNFFFVQINFLVQNSFLNPANLPDHLRKLGQIQTYRGVIRTRQTFVQGKMAFNDFGAKAHRHYRGRKTDFVSGIADRKSRIFFNQSLHRSQIKVFIRRGIDGNAMIDNELIVMF